MSIALFFQIFLIAVSLAADAFAVSLCKGVYFRKFLWKQALLLGVFFGFFQFLMPCLGAFLGKNLLSLIATWDHWVAFLLLCIVGGKMLYESFQPQTENLSHTGACDNGCVCQKKELSFRVLLFLSVATSLDALAVGFSLGLIPSFPILFAAILVGIVTFLLSVFAFYLGTRGACFLGKRAELVGGLILIGMGLKILYEHMF